MECLGAALARLGGPWIPGSATGTSSAGPLVRPITAAGGSTLVGLRRAYLNVWPPDAELISPWGLALVAGVGGGTCWTSRSTFSAVRTTDPRAFCLAAWDMGRGPRWRLRWSFALEFCAGAVLRRRHTPSTCAKLVCDTTPGGWMVSGFVCITSNNTEQCQINRLCSSAPTTLRTAAVVMER